MCEPVKNAYWTAPDQALIWVTSVSQDGGTVRVEGRVIEDPTGTWQKDERVAYTRRG